MSLTSEVERIEGLRDRIRTKLNDLKVINDNNATLQQCADAFDDCYPAKIQYGTLQVNDETDTLIIQCPYEGYNKPDCAIVCLDIDENVTDSTVAICCFAFDNGSNDFSFICMNTYKGDGCFSSIGYGRSLGMQSKEAFFKGTYKYMIKWIKS